MRKINWTIILTIIFALTAFYAMSNLMSAETPIGSFKGTVRLAEDMTGVSELEFHIYRLKDNNDVGGDKTRYFRTTTENDGSFSFTRLPAGNYQCSISTEAHSIPSENFRFTIDEGKTLEKDIVLKPNEPFIHIFLHQTTFNTKENIKIKFRSFINKDDLKLNVYRVRDDLAEKAWQGSLNDVLKLPYRYENGYDVDYNKVAGLKKVIGRNIDIRNSDKNFEGVAAKEIKIDYMRPGIYIVVLNDIEKGSVNDVGVIAVTDLEMVMKTSPTETLVYAVDAITGKPVQNVSLQLKSKDNVVRTGISDSEGQCMMLYNDYETEHNVMVVGRYNDSMAVASTYLYNEENDRQRVYIYTDRPIYRPGDTVNFKAIIRDLKGRELKPFTGREVSVKVQDSKNNSVFAGSFLSNNFGTINGQLPLDKYAIPGYYRITLVINGNNYEHFFNIAEYKKPEFEIKVKTDKNRYTMGENIHAEISANYFFGAPVVNGKVHYYISRDYTWYNNDDSFSSWDGDCCENWNDSGESGDFLMEGDGYTDDNGVLKIFIPTTPDKEHKVKDEEWDTGDNDWSYHIYADVRDKSDKYESGDTSSVVTRGEWKLRTNTDKYAMSIGESNHVELKLSDYNNKPIAGKTGRTVMEKTRWVDNKAQVIIDKEYSWTTNKDGIAEFDIVPGQSGYFTLRSMLKDTVGNKINSNEYIWVCKKDEESYDYPYDELDVTVDKDLYKAGEKAKVVVNTKLAPCYALMTIEGEKIWQHKVIKLESKTTLIDVGLSESYMPAVNVNFSIINGKDLVQAESVLSLSREKKAMVVKITSDKQTYLPRDKAVFHIKTTTTDGKPVSAETSFGLVDEALYNIADDDTEDIVSFFYPRVYPNVSTGFSSPNLYLSGDDKGGSTIVTREDFRDTAQWIAAIVTDANGEADLTVALPDNLTRWRATCRAITADSRVGQSTMNITVNKPFLVRLETPRFMVEDDTIVVAAIAHNMTAKPLDAQIGLDEADGISITENDKVRKVHVPANDSARVEWRISVPSNRVYDGAIKVRVWGRAGDYSDAMRLTIPAYPAGVKKTDYISGVTNNDERLQFELKKGFVPGSTKLTVKIAPSLISTMYGSLDFLANYPYGCTEQTVSSFIPDIIVWKLLQKYNVDDPFIGSNISVNDTATKIDYRRLKKELPKMVKSGLLKIYSKQSDGGGWGWYRYDHIDMWMTAYVLDGLMQARDAGFEINEEIFGAGRNVLKNSFIERMDNLAKYEIAVEKGLTKKVYKNELEYDYTKMIYTATILSKTGGAELGRQLIKKLDNLSISDAEMDIYQSLSLAELFIQIGEISRAREIVLKNADTIQNGIDNSKNSRRYDYYSWRSPTETVGKLLELGMIVSPADSRWDKLVSWLMKQRRDNYWYSTRDTVAVIRGICKYTDVKSKDSVSGNVQVTCGKYSVTVPLQPMDYMLPEKVIDIPLDELGEGKFAVKIVTDGLIYYSANLEQYNREEMKSPDSAGDAKLSVRREYRVIPRRGSYLDDSKPVTEFNNGDVVMVKLIINTAKPLDYCMVEDPLPAGFEPFNRGTMYFYEWSDWWSDEIVRDNKMSFALRYIEPYFNDSDGKLIDNQHIITYRCQARTPGEFNALPAIVYDMYNTNEHARSASQKVTIR